MIHIIFALKHHNTDTQQKSSTFVMHHSQQIYFSMKQLRDLTNTISIAESHIIFIL